MTDLLTLIRCGLLRADARLASLPHVLAVLTAYLDVSVHVTPEAAAASGSIRLFDRVHRRVTRDNIIPPTLRSHWLGLALQTALENDDLPMVQRIHAVHPEPLVVHALLAPPALYASTFGLALRYGRLETVQWVTKHRRDRPCCSINVCMDCLLTALPCVGNKDTFRVFVWLIESGVYPPVTACNVSHLWPFMIQSVEVVQWLHARRLLSRWTAEMVLARAIEDGQTSIVEYLLAKGCRLRNQKDAQCKLIHAACCGYTSIVEALLSSNQCSSFQHKFEWTVDDSTDKMLLMWNPASLDDNINGNETIRDVFQIEASRAGNLPVLQWLFHRYGTPPSVWHLQNHVKSQDVLLQIYQWMWQIGVAEFTTDSIDTASRQGFLHVVQWLYEMMPTVTCTTNAMDEAAANGHLHVVQWLHHNRSDSCSKQALTGAAGNGHVGVLQWLRMNRPELGSFVHEAAVQAACGGHLDLLVWLWDVASIVCARCILRAVLQRNPTNPTSLCVLRWLRTQRQTTCEKCAFVTPVEHCGLTTSSAACSVICTGDVDLFTCLSGLVTSTT